MALESCGNPRTSPAASSRTPAPLEREAPSNPSLLVWRDGVSDPKGSNISAILVETACLVSTTSFMRASASSWVTAGLLLGVGVLAPLSFLLKFSSPRPSASTSFLRFHLYPSHLHDSPLLEAPSGGSSPDLITYLNLKPPRPVPGYSG